MAEHTPLTEQRIAHIMGMMRRWEWKRGESGPVLAEQWGLSVDRVKDLAAEASKRVLAEVTDPALVSGTVGMALQRVLDEGMEATGDAKWHGRKLAVESSKAWAQIVGAMAPQRHEVATTEASPQKAADLVRAAFGRVSKGADKDDDDGSPGDDSSGSSGA